MEENSEKEKRLLSLALSYYSRQDIQKALFEFSKNRETIARHMDLFSKRPDSLEYPSDIIQQVRRGMTSFHCSEELWSNPLELSTDLSQDQINSLRLGWDLLLDIDCKWIDYSKLAAQSIIEVLENHGVKNYGLKFSVSGDTPILIQLENKISLMPISEAIALIKKGKKIKILSLNKNRQLQFSEVYDYLEHKDKLYSIYHEQSTIPIKATKHHSVFVWDRGEVKEKKVEEIKKGEFLVTYNSKNTTFGKNKEYVKNKFTLNKNKYTNSLFQKNVKITKELMRLIGYFLAEGHVTNIINQVGFSFNIKEVDYINDCKNILSQITKKPISIRHPNSGSTQILIHSKEWATFFDNFCGKKKNKHIPEFSWELSKELFLEMLRGYIRGDAHKLDEFSIVIKSVSKQLTSELIWLCKLNGISCTLSKEQGKPHKLPQGTYFKGSIVYILSIPKSELFELEEFVKKRTKFSPYPRDKTFPVDGLKSVYNQCKPKMFNIHRKEQMTLNKDLANLKRIRMVLDWFCNFKSIEFNEESKKIIKNYELLFKSDIGTVKVKKVIEFGEDMVYDVSVKDTEAFFGNYYPILLHNSGGKGFHIIVPWKAFPKEINNQETKNLFPEIPRKIASYIRFEAEKILKQELPEDFYKQFKDVNIKKGIKCLNCNEIVQEYKQLHLVCRKCRRDEQKKVIGEQEFRCPDCRKPMEVIESKAFYECKKCSQNSLKNPHNFSSSIEVDLFELMGLDVVLVSPRHLFRAPYSLHEKGLVSVVLTKEELNNFEPKLADPLRIRVRDFYPHAIENEARELLISALDWSKTHEKVKKEYRENTDFKAIQLDRKNIAHPPCIELLLKGVADGKKRAVFILINYFRSLGFGLEEIEKLLEEWNKKNKPPLKQGYISSQLSWSEKQDKMLPPNCDKEHYKAIGVCSPDRLCEKIKNPVNYTIRRNWKKQ